MSRFLPSSCEQAEIENDFQKKCRRRKIRRTYGVFGYSRRDQFFIFVGVGVFHPLSRRIVSTNHAALRVKTVASGRRPLAIRFVRQVIYPPSKSGFLRLRRARRRNDSIEDYRFCSILRRRKNDCTISPQRPASTPRLTSVRWFSCGWLSICITEWTAPALGSSAP